MGRGLEINLYHPPEGRSFRATVALSTRATGAAQLLPFLQAQQLPLLDVAWKGPRTSCRFCIFRCVARNAAGSLTEPRLPRMKAKILLQCPLRARWGLRAILTYSAIAAATRDALRRLAFEDVWFFFRNK